MVGQSKYIFAIKINKTKSGLKEDDKSFGKQKVLEKTINETFG